MYVYIRSYIRGGIRDGLTDKYSDTDWEYLLSQFDLRILQ
jgi:hypothetical protein